MIGTEGLSIILCGMTAPWLLLFHLSTNRIIRTLVSLSECKAANQWLTHYFIVHALSLYLSPYK